MNGLVTAMVVAGLILAGAGTVFSAEPKTEREKAEERIETLVTWKMMEALDLDQATADKVLGIRRKFDAQRRELNSGSGEDLAKLRQLLKEPPKSTDEKELAEVVARVRETRKKLRALKEERINEVSKVLTVRQQAELILFFQDFRSQIRGMVRPPERLGPPGRHGKDVGPPSGPRPHGQPPGPPPERPGPLGPEADQD